MNDSSHPRVSVVLATRNRGAEVIRAVNSILAMDPPADELLVVDQTDNDATQRALATLTAAGKLRVLRAAEVGVSRARNRGFRESHGDLLIFTDDDCEVAADLVGSVVRAFARWPRVGVLFGNVHPGPHDVRAGLVPCCVRHDEVVVCTVAEQLLVGGMGASMAVRRDVLSRLGGFDVCLGAGASLPAGEETDLVLRALAAGIHVAETPTIEIVHHGFRTWSQAEALADRYLFGTGAMYAKHLRLRPRQTGALLAQVFARWLWGQPRVTYGREPRRGARLLAFARGFARGLGMHIDPATGQFVEKG